MSAPIWPQPIKPSTMWHNATLPTSAYHRYALVQFNLGPYLVEVHDAPSVADPAFQQPCLMFFKDGAQAFHVPIVMPLEIPSLDYE